MPDTLQPTADTVAKTAGSGFGFHANRGQVTFLVYLGHRLVGGQLPDRSRSHAHGTLVGAAVGLKLVKP